MDESVALWILFAVLILGLFFLPRWRARQVANQVIDLLVKHGATTPSKAKSKEELRLSGEGTSGGIFEGGIFGQRDYKTNALEVLLNKGVVKQTEEGKFYLSEETVIARQTK